MKEIEYKVLGVDDLELLVELRIKDLKMFSNQKITHSTIENIRVFYKEKMLKDECHTLVGYHFNQIISTATIYYYDILPSNENSKGKVGQITNVWLGENVTILKGVTIGDNVIIGIGSIVTKDIPSNSVAVGVPAKIVGSYEEYYKKRRETYVNECIEYALAILASGKVLTTEMFYDDYPCFVDGDNYQEYNYPYQHIFNPVQFDKWKIYHKAIFKGFDDFVDFIKKRL